MHGKVKNAESIQRLRLDVAFFGLFARDDDTPSPEDLGDGFYFIIRRRQGWKFASIEIEDSALNGTHFALLRCSLR